MISFYHMQYNYRKQTNRKTFTRKQIKRLQKKSHKCPELRQELDATFD